jgi:hypothetical protein
MDDSLKTCTKCKRELNISNFYRYKDTYKSHCKDCIRIQRNNYYKTPKGFKYQIEKSWRDKGMVFTTEEYEELLVKQNYGCAICNAKSNRNGTRLCVDHCHTTGKIRGLLCHDCNTSLGKFEDNVELLQKAIDYVKKYK